MAQENRFFGAHVDREHLVKLVEAFIENGCLTSWRERWHKVVNDDTWIVVVDKVQRKG